MKRADARRRSTMPAMISRIADARCGSASVVTMAITMPAMPKRLPPRDVSGEDRPRSAMMKQIEATR